MGHGMVFNIQRFSVHDGPGIRTTVFLKGCPLRCSWCHNPEGIDPGPEIAVFIRRCIGCGECVEACPRRLPSPGSPPDEKAAELCLVCGACADACPCEARQVVGREMSVDSVMREILDDRVFFDESGGGVTFSGGEPLWQPEFLRQLLEACRSQGIATAVDTCGQVSWSALESIVDLTDLFLYDVKLMDDRQHRIHTGVSNRRILDNLSRLARTHHRIWLRVPVIPGVNDSVENIAAMTRLASHLEGIERVCLLPYHPLGEGKRERQDGSMPRARFSRPDGELLRVLAETVEAGGMTASVGG